VETFSTFAVDVQMKLNAKSGHYTTPRSPCCRQSFVELVAAKMFGQTPRKLRCHYPQFLWIFGKHKFLAQKSFNNCVKKIRQKELSSGALKR